MFKKIKNLKQRYIALKQRAIKQRPLVSGKNYQKTFKSEKYRKIQRDVIVYDVISVGIFTGDVLLSLILFSITPILGEKGYPLLNFLSLISFCLAAVFVIRGGIKLHNMYNDY